MDPQSPEPLAPQPRRFPLLPSLLVLLLGISTGFLSYQNWQLRKEIGSLSSLPPSSPTLNPTTNWQTYTDKQKSFSFQYPQDWTTDDEQLLGSRKEIDFIYNRTTVLALSIIANYNNATGKPFKSLEEYIGQRITKARNITAGNLNGKLITDTGEEGHVIPYQEAILFSPNNTNILSLYYQAAYYENPQADEILNQILSTFQFLEQTANWKTYTNTPMGFQLQYPGDWTVISEIPIIKLGPNNLPYLTIAKNYSEDINSLKDCVFPSQVTCLIGKGITNTALDNIPAKSAYVVLGGMVDNDTRIIQTVQKPTIELRMSIFIDGNDQTFDQILSTFQFTSD